MNDEEQPQPQNGRKKSIIDTKQIFERNKTPTKSDHEKQELKIALTESNVPERRSIYDKEKEQKRIQSLTQKDTNKEDKVDEQVVVEKPVEPKQEIEQVDYKMDNDMGAMGESNSNTFFTTQNNEDDVSIFLNKYLVGSI